MLVATTLRDARDRTPEASGQRLVPSQSSRLGSSARSPVSTRAGAAHRLAQRRRPGPRLRGWGEGGAARKGCPIKMGLGEKREM